MSICSVNRTPLCFHFGAGGGHSSETAGIPSDYACTMLLRSSEIKGRLSLLSLFLLSLWFYSTCTTRNSGIATCVKFCTYLADQLRWAMCFSGSPSLCFTLFCWHSFLLLHSWIDWRSHNVAHKSFWALLAKFALCTNCYGLSELMLLFWHRYWMQPPQFPEREQ